MKKNTGGQSLQQQTPFISLWSVLSVTVRLLSTEYNTLGSSHLVYLQPCKFSTCMQLNFCLFFSTNLPDILLMLYK